MHSQAPAVEATDWAQIVALYDVLLRLAPSPVIELNRAVAIAMRDGPASGLALIEYINKDGALDGYYWFYSAQADLYRRLGRTQEAREAYRKALTMTKSKPERRFLEERLANL